ncbi:MULTISPECIES: low-specificity L-threonine aldolase [Legionella]|uniref:Low specificity L-threonine aldolase n=1 Tax=Legionella maceachernii TaxID=466 RepID=A0A0W0W754_9GAMM|nr:low-specificity L-threonine aldolase [Legionella maceachernii]KTD28003.1 Low specificity L-threonine aldolase [Legionella maceachernii]SKA06617.1 L-threonine aldolase [Legionella maceachernii]SUO99879.1 Low specificity L-threonine aldolase [Legionella maceachernii]
MKLIDLRSDTVTRPSQEMLAVMMNADVGDDVYGEDMTVIELETMLADRAGMEAAVFAPSGTQSNLMALMAHCERGDEYIVGQTAHTFMWEGGGAAVLGSIQPQPLDFAPDGSLPLEKVALAIKPIDSHHPRTKLLCLENTTAGKVLPLSYLREMKIFCQENELHSHLDGARVFNAAVKLGVHLEEISNHFDSISICLSKGLGAPIGSVLCGSEELIKKARRWRKVLGGGMRQAGILAAAGIYALQHHVERLREDHENADFFARALAECDEIEVDLAALQTNIFFIQVKGDYSELRAYLCERGVLFAKQPNKAGKVRCVTHLNVSREDLVQVIRHIKSFYAGR